MSSALFIYVEEEDSQQLFHALARQSVRGVSDESDTVDQITHRNIHSNPGSVVRISNKLGVDPCFYQPFLDCLDRFI